MREILFRGKDANGNWHKGFYYCRDWEKTHWIRVKNDCRFIDCQVIPETVGQFTGLTDKNGVKIFEGDIYKDRWGKLSVVEFFYADEHKTSGHGSSDRIIIVYCSFVDITSIVFVSVYPIFV